MSLRVILSRATRTGLRAAERLGCQSVIVGRRAGHRHAIWHKIRGWPREISAPNCVLIPDFSAISGTFTSSITKK